MVLNGLGARLSTVSDPWWASMDPFFLNVMLALWIVGCVALLLGIWVWTELLEIKSDKSRINALVQRNTELEQRIAGMEKVMMKSGYRPPHRQ